MYGITRLNGHEFEKTPGVGDGQEILVCCSPWGRKESDTTERLNEEQFPGPQGSRLTKSKESSEGTGKMPQQGNDRALSELFRNNQGGVGPVLMRDEAVSDTVGAL